MGIAILGQGVISASGIGPDSMSESALHQLPPPTELGNLGLEEPLPPGAAQVIRNFNVVDVIGRRKGMRILDRTATLALAATHLALEDAGLGESVREGDRIGVILGTTTGGLRSLIQFVAETYTAEQPHQVSPEAFPRAVMNYTASQIGAWFGLRALNSTLAGGRLAGLLGLRLAARALRRGYADFIVTGSVQEFSPEGAWVAHHAAATRGHFMPVLGEGGIMFVLGQMEHSPGTGPQEGAELLACEVATAEGTGAPNLVQCLAHCITKALQQAAISPREVWAVSGRASGSDFLDEVETQALAAALPQHRPAHVLGIGRRLGDTYSASTVFQLAALLAGLKDSSAPKPAYGLVTAVSHGGVAGCALIRAG